VTAGEFLKNATAKLGQAGIDSGRLDCLILLEDATHHDRAWLLAHPEHKLSPYQLSKLNRQLEQRQKHQPLAYIRGVTEFYGRRFKLNKRVLEPRVESETMIDLLKKLPLPNKPLIADVGTGCGAIGITAALEFPLGTVDLYDIDSGALAVARHNEHLHELNLGVHKRDLLNRPARPFYDVVLANLPYVPSRWHINEAAMQEPRIAIFGGDDGLDLYRRLFDQLVKLPERPKFTLTEALPPQHGDLAKIAASHGFKLQSAADFIQVFRPA
jgi:release factor glutamine methyltransferase